MYGSDEDADRLRDDVNSSRKPPRYADADTCSPMRLELLPLPSDGNPSVEIPVPLWLSQSPLPWTLNDVVALGVASRRKNAEYRLFPVVRGIAPVVSGMCRLSSCAARSATVSGDSPYWVSRASRGERSEN